MVLLEGIIVSAIAAAMLGWNVHVMSHSGVCCPPNKRRESETEISVNGSTARTEASTVESPSDATAVVSSAGGKTRSPDPEGLRRRRIRADQRRKIKEQEVAAAVALKMGAIASGSTAAASLSPLPASGATVELPLSPSTRTPASGTGGLLGSPRSNNGGTTAVAGAAVAEAPMIVPVGA